MLVISSLSALPEKGPIFILMFKAVIFPNAGFLNKLKHYHFIFCRFMPFILQASHAKPLGEIVRERKRSKALIPLIIEGIDHNDGFGMFKVLSDLPMLGPSAKTDVFLKEGLWSEHLQPTPSDFPENLLALEAFMQKRDGHGRKPAIITFGSMMGVQNVQEGTQKALQQMGMNVVKFVNKTSMQSQRSEFSFTASSSGQEAAPDVFEIDYAPFDWLLPKSSVVICHGGAGTTFRSLWSGVPVVICPIISALICDQVSHGQFVERKGLGTWIESLAPSVAECVTAIEQALTCEQRCREASDLKDLATGLPATIKVGAKLQQEDGAAAAAAAVESMHIVMVTVLNVGNLCFGFTPAMTARRLRQRVVRRASYVSCGCGCLVREDMSIILQPNLAWPPVLGDAVETFRGLLARPIYAVDAVLRAPAQEFKIGP
ncbi:atg26 [Symbiodinium pilosum]|uniref:Atg26 protein n=1 Tax=Symbiodinium pilosum TaxID=2952 RepID=A0A812WRS2_SYMPI|nr:atg26 [Symbiodinium pilosum]